MTQIQDHYKEEGDAHKAVVDGLATTGRVITSAALIMVCVFSSFVLNGDPLVKEFGVGLAVAIAIDATLVRCLLVPAIMVAHGRPGVVAAQAGSTAILPPITIEGEEYFDPSSDREQRPEPEPPPSAEFAGHPRRPTGPRPAWRRWRGSSRRRWLRSKPSGPSVSARARPPTSRARLARDRLLELPPRQRASGKIARTPSRSIWPTSALDVLRRRLGLGGERRDDRADHLDAVAAREVAERVVGGHELALGRRHAADAARRPRASRRRSPPCRRRRGARSRRARPGRRRSARRGSPATARIALRGSCHQCGSSPVALRRAVDQRHPPRVAAGAVEHLVEPLVEVSAGAEHDVRLAPPRPRRWGAARSRAGRRWVAGSSRPRRAAPRRSDEVGHLGGRGRRRVTLASPASFPAVAAQPMATGEQDVRRGRGQPAHGGAGHTIELRIVLNLAVPRSHLADAQDCCSDGACSPSAPGASSSHCAGGALGLVLGNIRLPAVLLVASSPAACSGAPLGISGVAAFARGHHPHPRRAHQLAACSPGWRRLRWPARCSAA